MRLLGLLLVSGLVAAPAFAQVAPQTVVAGKTTAAPKSALSSPDKSTNTAKFSLGVLDQVEVRKAPERVTPNVAPIDTDQLALSWRPGGKWGISLDLTSRSANNLLPREELSAGAYYQITPRFRFGGGVTLNGDNLRSAAEGWQQNEGEAGVRLESAFSF
jgi:hypothetical protein